MSLISESYSWYGLAAKVSFFVGIWVEKGVAMTGVFLGTLNWGRELVQGEDMAVRGRRPVALLVVTCRSGMALERRLKGRMVLSFLRPQHIIQTQARTQTLLEMARRRF